MTKPVTCDVTCDGGDFIDRVPIQNATTNCIEIQSFFIRLGQLKKARFSRGAEGRFLRSFFHTLDFGRKLILEHALVNMVLVSLCVTRAS